ncbi:MAG: hypothetical protein J7L76_01100 [Spirochaetaceae bacterium]|nr:hypothetical protein [Spirochaetaceae bacterium]
MFQLYLLTVLTTVLAGLALATGFLSNRFERFSEYTDFMGNPVYRIILGGVSVLVGIINLFPSYTGDIAVLGNLLPSLAGIVTGLLLIAEYFSSRRTEEESKTVDIAEKVEKFSGPYLTIVGISSIVIGILHAIIPRLPLL